MSAQNFIKINNSYESEPSSSSSVNEQLEYNTVYDESMHLPYVLRPPSYETEVIIAADGNYLASSQENTIPLKAMSSSLTGIYEEQSPNGSNKAVIISPTISQKSPFKGFSESPYGKLQRQFFSTTSITPQVSNFSTNVDPHTTTEHKPLSSKGGIVFSRFYDMVMDENSCNAVDIQLPNDDPVQIGRNGNPYENGVDYLVALSKESEKVKRNILSEPFRLSLELSFNGKIKSLSPPKMLDERDAIEIPCPTLNRSFILKKYSNEKSPDLFCEDEDDDCVNADAGDKSEYHFRAEDLIEFIDGTSNADDAASMKNVANEAQEQIGLTVSEKYVENVADISINKSQNCVTESSFADDQTCELDSLQLEAQSIDSYSLFRENCRREKELLRRTRKCLVGIPPPPSVTIPQLDMFSAVISRKQDILDFSTEIDTSSGQDSYSSISLFKPTHTIDEAKEMGWRQVLGVRQHGFCFNLCKASENNEYLALSVIERFIGAETASSYRNSPSSAKKRNARLKLLTQSPGNRLSHLARRRATFSSAQLATQKSCSLLGPQILVDVKKKNKHRRKNTPKRMTPGSKKKTRKTPTSSARKRLFRCDLIKLGPSREASKRALFQSPPKQLEHRQPIQRLMHTIKPEIANRVEKSKRALFSPDKQSEGVHLSANLNYASFGKKQRMQMHTDQQHTRLSMQQFDSILKRKHSAIDDDDTGDSADLPSQSMKLLRGGAADLTPRALKIKSQSFCLGAGPSSTMMGTVAAATCGTSANDVTSRDFRMQTNLVLSSSTSFASANASSFGLTSTVNASKIQRSHSDMLAQTNSLTENQRKKLLWAVSQALQEKKITTKHESFKQYAAVLARVVRRIFQEFFQKGSTSNSETLLRLAKRYVHNVIVGRCADDIYLQAKTKIIHEKNESSCRLNGYIGPEEYQRLKDSQQQQLLGEQTNLLSQNSMRAESISNIYSADRSLDSFGFGVTKSHEMTLTTNTIDSTFTTNSQISEGATKIYSSLKKTPIQPNALLHNSSSKNNMCGLALRENVDFVSDQRRSAQKNFTGKDQRNVSPYAHNSNHYLNNNQLKANIMQSASVKCASSVGTSQLQTKSVALDTCLLHLSTTKVKRQISFDT